MMTLEAAICLIRPECNSPWSRIKGPFCEHGATRIMTQISHYIHSFLCDTVIDPCPNLNANYIKAFASNYIQ